LGRRGFGKIGRYRRVAAMGIVIIGLDLGGLVRGMQFH
jgi:hypothetical protein